MRKEILNRLINWFILHKMETSLNVSEANTMINVNGTNNCPTPAKLLAVRLKNNGIEVFTDKADTWIPEEDILYDMKYLVYDAIKLTLDENVLN